MEIVVLHCSQWKTYRKHRFCVGTNQTHKENIGVACEPMENTRNTHVCCVETDGKTKGNAGVAWEPIEDKRKTQSLRANQWKTQ